MDVYVGTPLVAFDSVLFPTDISYGSAGGPEFVTEMLELSGGNAEAVLRLPAPRERWNVAYGVRNEDKVGLLMRFFMCRRGRAGGFYFQIPNDHRVEDVVISDGAEVVEAGTPIPVLLERSYTSGSRTATRTRLWIYDPEVDLTITLNDVICSGNFHPYTIDSASSDGVLSIVFDEELAVESVIRASYDFVIKARFDTDFLPYRLDDYLAGSVEVPIVEIIPVLVT